MSQKNVALYFNLDCHFKRMDSKTKVSIVQYSSEKSTKRKIKSSLNCVQILINAELQIGKKR